MTLVDLVKRFFKKKRTVKKKEGIGTMVLWVGCILIFRWLLFDMFIIPSGSMMPNLVVNDHIGVFKSAYGIRLPFVDQWLVTWGQPNRGDVIVFKKPNDSIFMIKRLIAQSNDVIVMDENGALTLNGKTVPRKEIKDLEKVKAYMAKSGVIPEDLDNLFEDNDFYEEELGGRKILIKQRKGMRRPVFHYEVPKDHYFVMGDNRDNSADSRFWGTFHKDLLRAPAKVVLSSCRGTIIPHLPLCLPWQYRGARFLSPIL